MPALSPLASAVLLCGWIGCVCGLILVLGLAELVVQCLVGAWEDLTDWWRPEPRPVEHGEWPLGR